MDFIYHFLAHLGYTHPLHPPLTHMPIGLVVGALILYWGGCWLKRPGWLAATRYCVVLAMIFLFFTAVTGNLDWQHYFAEARLAAITIKLILTAVLLVLLLFLVFLGRSRPAAPGVTYFSMSCTSWPWLAWDITGGNLR